RTEAGNLEQEAEHGARHDHQAEDEREGDEGATGEHVTPGDEADAGGADRQQVRANRHRADDQDRAVGDDAEGGDHGGDVDQGQVAGEEPRVRARLADHLDPGVTVDAAFAEVVAVLGGYHFDPGEDVV